MKEIRVAEIRAEAPAGAESLTLWGQPIVFDTPTTIHDPAGLYRNYSAWRAGRRRLSDVRLFYNHDLSKVPLARTPKTMQLSMGAAGLEMKAALPSTEEARAVYEAVNAGIYPA